MKNLLTTALLFVFLFPAYAQTANSFNSVVPYTGSFQYGMNPGFWGTQFNNPQLGQLAANAGAKSVRINMPDYYIGPYGGNFFANDLAGYAASGLTNNVGFLGSVWPSNQLDSTFPGCSSNSLIWRGTYLPIWTDSANGIIDTANTWANYVYKLVTGAGSSIKFWELINEMDFTGNTQAAGGFSFNVTQNKQDSSSWWNVPPAANDLVNLKAPIFYYIHMMRVAYNIIKRIQPNEYVCVGGIGYPATLDVLMRYTDNPVDGSVTPQFPLTGGAYFDVINFHTYPMYNLNLWNNACNCFTHFRYSDYMIDVDTMYVHQYDSVQVVHGYNNTTYPKKIYISTETDAPQDSLDDGMWGSLPSAINYTIKWNVASQAYGLKQLDKYALGSQPLSNTSSEFNHCGLYGDITEDTCTVQNAPKTQEWYGYKTMSTLLYGKTYDAVKTAAMNIPGNMRGYAFNDGAGNYTYVMWAKTSIDLSEGANATYTFPFAFSGTRMEWNYSLTDSTSIATQTVALTGYPSFFVATSSSNNPPVANAGANQLITLPTTTVTLAGSATDSDGTVTSYKWTKASGPVAGTITSPTNASTTVTNLAAGVYEFVLTVTDNLGSTGTDTMQVTVNTPPISNAGLDQTISLPTNSVTLNGSATDSTGTIASYLWTKVSGPTAGVIINPTSAGTTVTGLVGGIYKFSLSVKDNNGASSNDTMQVIVNIPPVANAGSDQSITLPTNSITLSGIATDADGTIASYLWTKISGPASGTITSTSSANTTVTGLVAGTYKFALKVKDNLGATGTDTMQVTVNPAIPVISGITSASGTVGTTFSYTITASNTPASYAATGLPAGLTINTSAGIISGTPTVTGTFNVTISATNAGGTGSGTLVITINPAAPVISSSTTASGTVGLSFSYTITASNTPTSYAASGLPAGLTMNISTGVISGTPTATGTSNIIISAINTGGTGTATLVLTVNAASTNKAPVANAGDHNLLTWALTSNGTVVSSGPVTGSSMLPGTNFPSPGTFNTDGYKCTIPSGNWPTTAFNGDNIDFPLIPNANIDLTIQSLKFTVKTSGGNGNNLLSLAYEQDSSGTWVPFGTAQTATSGTTTNINFGTLNQLLANGHKYIIRLYVYAAGTSTTSGRSIYIKNVVITGTSAIDITLPTNSVTLNGSGNDSDGTIAAYNWVQASGPSAGTITNPAAASTTVTNLTTGTYKFVLTVTDNLGATGTDTIQVTVNSLVARDVIISTSIDTSLSANVYPNPAQSTLYTSINASASDLEFAVILTDIAGRTLYKTKALSTGTTTNLQMDVSHLINGIYFLTIQSGNKCFTKKIIKGS